MKNRKSSKRNNGGDEFEIVAYQVPDQLQIICKDCFENYTELTKDDILEPVGEKALCIHCGKPPLSKRVAKTKE